MTRLSRAERERQIIQAAIRFFAEVGFAGRTRELAERAGITQPLLYRYFVLRSGPSSIACSRRFS